MVGGGGRGFVVDHMDTMDGMEELDRRRDPVYSSTFGVTTGPNV
jgi:hypothetical protein